ncbi:MAG: bifunctional DNA primase/polymerase, partial [Planctomycetota bacterium]|nr:bifunctional DNA primase/polymerase [Planctomycetota bacterium]
LDIDPRNGEIVEALEELAGGPLPQTLTAWSGRGDGGRHFYFLRPVGPFASTRLPAGIDLKVNGYCILPPSIHPASGQPYRWDVRPPAPLPLALLAALRPHPVHRGTVTVPQGHGEPLVRLVLGLTEGQRNRGLYWAACRAAGDGLLTDIRDDLVRAALSIGLSEHEAQRTIDSASRQVTR